MNRAVRAILYTAATVAEYGALVAAAGLCIALASEGTVQARWEGAALFSAITAALAAWYYLRRAAARLQNNGETNSDRRKQKAWH